MLSVKTAGVAENTNDDIYVERADRETACALLYLNVVELNGTQTLISIAD